MMYCIVELDDGLVISEWDEREAPEKTAERQGGVLVDPGPYPSYEDAADALISLQIQADNEEASDLPDLGPPRPGEM